MRTSEIMDVFGIHSHIPSKVLRNDREILDFVKNCISLQRVFDERVLCKDCKYFEYDSVAKVHGVPLIVAHEICNRWGEGCKTRENGWCFLAESKENDENDEV